MTAPRSRKEELEYRAYRKKTDTSVCEFCKSLPDQIIMTTGQFKVIRNKFPYTIWDGQTVIDHLMIVPKTHTDTVADFSDDMIKDYFRIVKEYETQGYNTYARAPVSKIKSIGHQHTHLLKTQGRSKSFVLLIRRPFYFRYVKS
jgi:diadenosine tetraphosphate (Ap4A) HIT family hydrolase